MQRLKLVGALVIGAGLYCAMAAAADPGLNLDTAVGDQKVKVQVTVGNPAVIAVKTQGAINTDLNIQRDSSGNCLLLVEQLAPGVCVPSGGGGPVSPN